MTNNGRGLLAVLAVFALSCSHSKQTTDLDGPPNSGCLRAEKTVRLGKDFDSDEAATISQADTNWMLTHLEPYCGATASDCSPMAVGTCNLFHDKSNWRGLVSLMSDASAREELLLWKAGYEEGDENELEYCLATYLMAKNSESLLFQPSPRNGDPEAECDLAKVIEEYNENRELFDVELGQPVAAPAPVVVQGGEVWERRFSRGLVLCNPSETDSYTVSLKESMRRAGHGTVNMITLKPCEGAILLSGV